VGKAIKEMRNRKATGVDDVPGDVLKLLGEGVLGILTTTNQHHIMNWRVAQELHRSYNDCLKRKRHKLPNAATVVQSALLHIQQR